VMVWCWMYRTLNQGQRLLSVHRALLVLVHCAVCEHPTTSLSSSPAQFRSSSPCSRPRAALVPLAWRCMATPPVVEWVLELGLELGLGVRVRG
jgi:hypothetical protein